MVTPAKPSPAMNSFCLYPLPVLRCFWKGPLMNSTPTTPLKESFTATYYSPPPPPPPHHHHHHKKFDHTSTEVLLDTGTPGTSREIRESESDHRQNLSSLTLKTKELGRVWKTPSRPPPPLLHQPKKPIGLTYFVYSVRQK